tara:strand:- start:73583 stop:74056 length:474 start_codon:yes stop_codon:yes gene_type:complete
VSSKKDKDKSKGKINELVVQSDGKLDLPTLIDYANSRGGFDIAPTEQGAKKEKSLDALRGQTQIQLDNILEQMKILANQANALKERVEISHLILDSKYNFDPVEGEIYYLYQVIETSTKVLSLLSPEDWKDNEKYNKDSLLGVVEYCPDNTWKLLKS